MAEKTNANIGFEKQLWDAACVLWGHIPAAEYRKVIIGLIFLRYISAAFDKRYQELVEEGDGGLVRAFSVTQYTEQEKTPPAEVVRGVAVFMGLLS